MSRFTGAPLAPATLQGKAAIVLVKSVNLSDCLSAEKLQKYESEIDIT